MPPKKASATATAASDRPRRAGAVTPTETAKNPDSKTAPQAKKRKAATKEADAPVKKRGRPSKAVTAATKEDADEPEEPVEDAPATTKKRGRLATKGAAKAKSAVACERKAAPRKRGRPPKGGEATKSHADQEAAEGQL
ncbi:hypothetical protein LTR12_016701 [Friedmanniomyces endolithicus]|nr:hypothetical protein LTR12_016701 [Friedmanniomyces endolithicus]